MTTGGAGQQAALALYKTLPPVQQVPQAWLDAAERLIGAGDCRRAKLLLETVLQADQQHVQAAVMLVNACLELGGTKWPEAVQVARRAVTAVSSSESHHAEQTTAAHLALAAALGHAARTPVMAQPERSKHRAEARALLEAVLQRSPSSTTALYMLALISAEGGHFDAALHHARAALQDSPQQAAPEVAALLALLALLMSARQQPQAALAAADAGLAATQALPGAAAVGVLLARIKAKVLLAGADVNGALMALGSAKRELAAGAAEAGAAGEASRQQEAQVWRDMALIYAGQQQVADARLCVEQAAQLDPRSADTLHAQGAVHEAAGGVQAATDAYQSALALDSSHAEALLSLGTLLRRQGSPADLCVASSLITDALRYQPHNHLGWYNLGLVCRAQGHREDAQRHLLTSVKLAASAPVLSYSELPLCV